MLHVVGRATLRSVLAVVLLAATLGVAAGPALAQEDEEESAVVTVDSGSAGGVTLSVEGPETTVVGEPIVVEVEATVQQAVVAYRVDVGVPDAEIEVARGGTLGAGDLVTDRSVGSLGDRAVLAATSCPSGGCERDGTPTGASGVLDLGAVEITPLVPGPLTVTVVLSELVTADGESAAELPVAEAGLEVRVTGRAEAPPAEIVAADGVEDTPSDAGDPDPEEPADERFAVEAADGCDPTSDTCTSIAEVQVGQAEIADGPSATTANAGGGASLTLVVDTARDGAVQPAYDANTGNGICATPSGDCTLRAALQEANDFAGHVEVLFAIPGTGVQTIQLVSSLPSLRDDAGVTIDGYSQPGAAVNTDPLVSNAAIMVEIRGGGPTAFDAVKIRSDNNVVKGLAIYDARRPIWMKGPAPGDGADDNLIVGNFVGTDAAGTFATNVLAPTAHGIHIEGESGGNVMGTPALADRNVVSGNARHGIGIWHANSDGNVIQNNIVGLSPDGTTALANAKHGLDVNFSAADTRIGGLGVNEGNLVSGNLDSAIEVSHNPLDSQGQVPDMSTQVLGNRIGTFPDGETFSTATANFNTGVFVEDGVTNTLIDGNTIVNNGKGGIRILNGGGNGNTSGTVVRNNFIGVSPLGVAIANGQVGVSVESSGSTIGPGNTIANTPGPAITSSELDAVGNTFTANSMAGNTGLGIELSPPGTNVNDPGDADVGPNDLLNYPDLTRTTEQVFEGTACAGCTVEFFTVDTTPGAGLAGGAFIGTIVTDGTGAFSFANTTVAQGVSVTATTTDTAQNTSEFAPAWVVTEHSDPPTVDAGPDVDVDEGSTVQLTATGSDPDLDPITYDWDLDGDGTFETPGQSVTFDASAVDGPATFTVTARATDDVGLIATDSAVVTVLNVAPTGVLDAPATVTEFATFALSVQSVVEPSPDDTAAGVRFQLACPGETLPPPDYATASTSPGTTCTAPDGPASPAVQAHILDDDGGVTTLSSTVVVDNVAPTVVIGGLPGSADEGDALALDTTVTDPSPDDVAAGFTSAWTVDLNGAPVLTGTDPTLSLTLTDSGTWDITATATDVDGGIGADAQSLPVNNVAPTADFETDAVSGSGQVDVTLSLTNPVEPGPDDVTAGLRYAFDCLGGSLAAVTYATASTTASEVCTYTTGATSYPVTAVIIDKDEGRTEYATVASIDNNQAPVLTVDPSFPVDEGGTVTVTASAVDPEGGAVTYDWDLDGDGTFETPGQSVAFDASALDGPITVGVAVRATDPAGLASSAQSSVVVANVQPSVSLSPFTVDEGSAVDVDLSGATDPSPDDLATLRYAVDCAGGSLASITYASASTSPITTCPFDDGPSSGTISAKVLDDDGGSVEVSAGVTVDNVDPTATIIPPGANLVEGASAAIVLEASDPSSADAVSLGTSWTAMFDGAPLASGSGLLAAFDVPDDGVVTLDMTVIDKDGGTGTAQALLTVDGAAPTGQFSAPASADEGVAFDVAITDGDDAGPADVSAGLRYAFSCDGTPITATYATAVPSSVQSCIAVSGSQTVIGRVIDKDDLFTEYTAQVDVGDVAPTARFVAPRQASVGRTITLEALSASEPGVEYSFDCGSGAGPFSQTATATCTVAAAGPNAVSMTVRDAGLLSTTYDAVVIGHANLVDNGSFEVDGDGDGEPDGWTLPGSGAVQTSSTAYDGTTSLEQTTTTFRSSAVRTELLPAHRSATVLSGWVEIADAGTSVSAQLEVSWYNSSGSLLSTSRTDSITSVTGGWVELAKRIVPPQNTTQARVRVKLQTDGGAVVRADQVELRYDNELLNADLDLDDDLNGRPDSWWPSSRFTITATEVHDTVSGGDLSSDGSNFTIGQRVRQAVPGEEYHGSLWVNVPEDASNAIVRASVRWKDASNNNIGSPVLLAKLGPTATPGWVQISGSAVAPANAAEVLLEVRIAGNLTTTMYVDSSYLGLS